MAVEIGQLRYSSPSQCLGGNLNISAEVYQTGNSNDDSSFQFDDVVITNKDGNFKASANYYITLKIPRDINYDIDLNVKLLQANTGGGEQVYQFVKKLSIPRGGLTSNAYEVLLYEYDDEVRAGIPVPITTPEDGIPIFPTEIGSLYYIKSGVKKSYYVVTGDGNKQLDKTNNVTMTASWKDNGEKLYNIFTFCFKPVADGFNKILLEMSRTAEDYSIQNGDGSFGRKLDLEEIKNAITAKEIYIKSVTNLVPAEIAPLQQIGIWGRPGLPLLVNNEEIKIGSSGYYELDILPITNLGIISQNNNDAWTVDYTYFS